MGACVYGHVGVLTYYKTNHANTHPHSRARTNTHNHQVFHELIALADAENGQPRRNPPASAPANTPLPESTHNHSPAPLPHVNSPATSQPLKPLHRMEHTPHLHLHAHAAWPLLWPPPPPPPQLLPSQSRRIEPLSHSPLHGVRVAAKTKTKTQKPERRVSAARLRVHSVR